MLLSKYQKLFKKNNSTLQVPFPQAVSLCTHSQFVTWLARRTDSHGIQPTQDQEGCLLQNPRKPQLTFQEHCMGWVLPSFLFPHRDSILCIYYPLLTPATHCFDRITLGYKTQGSAIRWYPSARTSQAQVQPILARSSRKWLCFEAKTANLSFCFPCFIFSFFLFSLLLFSSPSSDFIPFHT